MNIQKRGGGRQAEHWQTWERQRDPHLTLLQYCPTDGVHLIITLEPTQISRMDGGLHSFGGDLTLRPLHRISHLGCSCRILGLPHSGPSGRAARAHWRWHSLGITGAPQAEHLYHAVERGGARYIAAPGVEEIVNTTETVLGVRLMDFQPERLLQDPVLVGALIAVLAALSLFGLYRLVRRDRDAGVFIALMAGMPFVYAIESYFGTPIFIGKAVLAFLPAWLSFPSLPLWLASEDTLE